MVNGKPRKTVSDSYLHQISILSIMPYDVSSLSPRHILINEIAEKSGLKDEKEVLRYLYILEGQKLVSPEPVGDFTSKVWHITKDGVRALKVIDQSAMV